MGDAGANEEQHHRDTHGSDIDLRPVSGQQHNLTDIQK